MHHKLRIRRYETDESPMELIAAYNLNMIHISKYCRSIELATGWAPGIYQRAQEDQWQ
jgi:hypothetical protein